MGSVNPIFILEFGDCEYANVQGESTGKVYAAHRERELRRKIWKDVEYMKQGIRTDLAVEIRESIEKEGEIPGVELTTEEDAGSGAKISKVIIKNNEGQRVMQKPIGTYITIETGELTVCEDEEREKIADTITRYLLELSPGTERRQNGILVVGLGNRDITPDALGPWVVGQLPATRHLHRAFPELLDEENPGIPLAAIAPGVMGQSGMEAVEVIKGVVREIEPAVVVIIDALAARSTERLNRTVQMTDSGISPGAGVGNFRSEISKKVLGVPVIAVGVPTVIDAATIVSDRMERALQKNGLTESEIEQFLQMLPEEEDRFFVTPKDVDEAVRRIGDVIAQGIDRAFGHPLKSSNYSTTDKM